MKKNVNIKIVIIYFILGIVLILGFGLVDIFKLNQLEELGSSQQNIELVESVQYQVSQLKIIMIFSIIVYTIISILIGYFVLKAVVSPMKRLIKSAEKVATKKKIENNKVILQRLIKLFF